MKKRLWIDGCAAIIAFSAILVILGSCKQTKVVETPLSSTPTQSASVQKVSSPGPHPEGAVSVPEVTKKEEQLLIVYRHTGFGYAESYGFDTYILRILTDSSGQIVGGTSYKRMITGEIAEMTFNTSVSGKSISLAASSDQGQSWSDTLLIKDDSIEVSGKHKMVVSLDKQLVIASLDKKYQESFSVDPTAKGLPSEIRRSETTLEKGKWSSVENEKAVYVQSKPEDDQNAEGFQITLWNKDKSEFRFATVGPEPLNEVYASGLAEVLSGDHALINATLLDLMIGESTYLRPIYAFAISKRGTAK
jgi:hypothetical protein